MHDEACADESPLISPLVREQYDELLGARRGDFVSAPERALMQAMLQDAVLCLIGQAAPARERAQLASDARQWVASRSCEWVFAFENVCDALGLDSEYARRRLLAMSDTHSTTAVQQGGALRALRKGSSRRRRAIHFMGGRRRRLVEAVA